MADGGPPVHIDQELLGDYTTVPDSPYNRPLTAEEAADFARVLGVEASAIRSCAAPDGPLAVTGLESYADLVSDPLKSRLVQHQMFFADIKCDVLREVVTREFPDADRRTLRILDVGCGTGLLMHCLRRDFEDVWGCDPAEGMIARAGERARRMPQPTKIPFASGSFDVALCVCVYHHVTRELRVPHMAEIRRVLKPGGILAVFEHNPLNPVTRRIVARCPMDAEAQLLSARMTRRLFRQSGLKPGRTRFYLFLPEWLYRRMGWTERLFSMTGLGGQYCAVGRKPRSRSSSANERRGVRPAEESQFHPDPGTQIDYAAEREFHEEWGGSVDPRDVQVVPLFEAPTAPERQFIMEWLGDVRGLRVLDLGCGFGEAATYFALKGARVTAADLSANMLDITQRVARRHGVVVETVRQNADRIDLPERSFDVVYAGNLLHHVDLHQCLQTVAGLLKPEGRFVSTDPLRHNPVINIYRRMATAVRTDDECPLSIRDVEAFRAHFEEVTHRGFWLTTLWLMARFYLLEGVHPNEQRYWERLITDADRLAPKYRRLKRIDDVLLRWMPWLQRMCWNLVVCARRPRLTAN